MLAAASSSSSRTAGLLTVGSTFSTSTLGTSSGRSPAGAGSALKACGLILVAAAAEAQRLSREWIETHPQDGGN